MTDIPEADPLLVALMAELGTVETLLTNGHLNLAGKQWAFHWLTHPNQVVAGNAAIVRERLVAAVIASLAAETGLPETYWTDRLLVDIPDDASDLDGAS